MIPISDPSGRVLGFGARVLDGAPKTIAKYVNSKDSPVPQQQRTTTTRHNNRPRGIDLPRVAGVQEGRDPLRAPPRSEGRAEGGRRHPRRRVRMTDC